MSYMHLGNIVAIYIFFGKKVRPNEGDSIDLKHLGVRRPEMGKKHNNQEKPKKSRSYPDSNRGCSDQNRK